MSDDITHFTNQVGGARSAVEYTNIMRPGFDRNINNQRGFGVGAHLGGLYRQVYPLLGRTAKPVGQELLSAGVSVLGDVLSRNVGLKKSLEQRLTESGVRLKRKAADTIEDMVNNPQKYKSKRKRRSPQKGSGRRRVRTKKSRLRKRKTKVVKKRRKSSTKRRVKKTTRDVYDIFGSS